MRSETRAAAYASSDSWIPSHMCLPDIPHQHSGIPLSARAGTQYAPKTLEGAAMLDVPMIQTRGFRNRAPGEGFQVRIRSPYYRGVWTSLIDGVSVTV